MGMKIELCLTELTDSRVLIRVSNLSTIPIRADLAGTKLPIWAKSTIRATYYPLSDIVKGNTCFMYILFPDALGPVKISSLAPSNVQSLGTTLSHTLSCNKCLTFHELRRHGLYLPSLISKSLPSVMIGFTR